MMTWTSAPLTLIITCLRTMVPMPMNLKVLLKMGSKGLKWFQHSQLFHTKRQWIAPMMLVKLKEDSRKYSTTTLHMGIDWTYAILSHQNSTRLCKMPWLSKIQPILWRRKNSIYSFARSISTSQTCSSTSSYKFWPWSDSKSTKWAIILFHCRDC